MLRSTCPFVPQHNTYHYLIKRTGTAVEAVQRDARGRTRRAPFDVQHVKFTGCALRARSSVEVMQGCRKREGIKPSEGHKRTLRNAECRRSAGTYR
jgi:hypothetical protein